MHSQDLNYEEQQQILNESRFMIQQLNLDDQPTQQQVLQRAEQLQIDDLLLAKESLTKQLDPQWKPYCNRYGEIYYINLNQKLAYIDHPIDMLYKVIYAKNNQMPIPKFKWFKIDKIAQSLDLIQNQIRNYKQQSHKTTLRIVYEEPSEQQAVSQQPRTPMHEQDFIFQSNNKKQQQLNVQELDLLYQYQRQLEKKYQQQFNKNKKQIQIKINKKQKDHQDNMKRILQSKLEEISEIYEEQIKKKNKLDYQKHVQKLQIEYQHKRMEYTQNIHKFNHIFEQFRQQQRNVEENFQIKNAAQRLMMVQEIKQRANFQKQKTLQNLKHKMAKQFNQKLIQLLGSNKTYQQNIKKSLDNIFNEIDPKVQNRGYKRPQRIYKAQRKQIFSKPNKEVQINKMKRDIEYQELKKQIRQLTLWQDDNQNQNQVFKTNYVNENRSSLNLRLRMRII